MKVLQNRFSRFLLTVLLPLIAGLLIYLFCSPSARYFFQFFSEPSAHFPLRNWISFSLPDGLWTFSFVSFVLIIFHEKNSLRTIFIFITLLTGPLLEIFQLFHFIPGTFDTIDILFQLISGMLAILCAKLFSDEREFYLQKFRTTFSIVGCFAFLVMALATSESGPPPDLDSLKRSISIINKTNHPVHIIEEGIIDFKLDSGTGNFQINTNPADIDNYFIFAYGNYNAYGQNDYYKYPGIVKNGIKTATITQIQQWKKEGKLRSYGFFMDQTLLVPEEHKIDFQTDTNGVVNKVSFWLMTNYDYSFATMIPDSNWENKLKSEDFPSYRIYFTNQKGKPDSLKIQGREFYKYINKKGEFEIR